MTKLNPLGSGLAYSTFLGGSDADEGHGIAVDRRGPPTSPGTTVSPDFPTTAGAFDTLNAATADRSQGRGFVTKLNPAGSGLAYSTYLGGSAVRRQATGIALDSARAAYVTGSTTSTDFPTTSGAFDTSFNGGVLTRSSPS